MTSTSWSEFSIALKPSPIGGIGVFATHFIKAGTRIFTGEFVRKKRLIKDIPESFRKYCIYINDEECYSPERFDRMETGWFLNHSDHPNMGKNVEGLLVALRDIQADEEILVDYNRYEEPEHLKEDYYR